MFSDLVHGIVYERGARVMMLLDVAIRLGSDNRESLFSVTAELCRTFEGGAFHRSDFLAALERTGVKLPPPKRYNKDSADQSFIKRDG